jgi:hypothetical protein
MISRDVPVQGNGPGEEMTVEQIVVRLRAMEEEISHLERRVTYTKRRLDEAFLLGSATYPKGLEH